MHSDYSDSGEELSDDDIEIDYEDDEDDEEVVEVKPLPPVARSVYKKNDWTIVVFCLVVSASHCIKIVKIHIFFFL